jgi:hypothetical protein
MTIELSHFSAALFFAFCASIVFGITQRNLVEDEQTGKLSPIEMIKYGSYCFVLFVGGVFLASWAMWVLKH